MIIRKLKCLKCGFEWVPRVENPKACPFCRSRKWCKKKEEKK